MMDAMIFAAGLGTRLGDTGRDTPKALLELGGLTMLERTARALVAAGADRIVVNVHHHADRIEAFIASRDMGAEIVVSREEGAPLETGGGLLHAARHFRRAGSILLHNVDVVSGADLRELVAAHAARGTDGSAPLATLLVHPRETMRYLLFDDGGLAGREDRRNGFRQEVRAPRGEVRALAFSGIHVISPRLLDLVAERGVFPIVDAYLGLAARGHRIAPWVPADLTWIEIGNEERLRAARALFDPPGR